MKRQPSGKLTLSLDAFGGESVKLDVAAIGGRIRAARNELGMTQNQLAAFAGAKSKSGLQDNEAGKNMPGGQMIGALVRAGINANWLLTEEGPMLLDDFGAAAPTGLDPARLQLAIATVEEGLATNGRVMAPDKKAELVLAVYDIYQEPGVTRERVLKLVKSAA